MIQYIDATAQNDSRVSDTEQVGIAGFIADVKLSQSEEFTQDAPTVPLEDGSFANDHLIKKPVIVTIEGDVSTVTAGGLLGSFVGERVPKPLNLLDIYSPDLSKVQNDITKAQRVTDVTNKALYGIAPLDGSAQEKFIDHIGRIYRSGTLIDIETPHRVMSNMAIISFSTKKRSPGDNIAYSIRLQQLEFVTVAVTALKKYKGKTTGSGVKSSTHEGEQGGDKVKNQSLIAAIFS